MSANKYPNGTLLPKSCDKALLVSDYSIQVSGGHRGDDWARQHFISPPAHDGVFYKGDTLISEGKFAIIKSMSVDSDGKLTITTDDDEVHYHHIYCYKPKDGLRRSVEGLGTMLGWDFQRWLTTRGRTRAPLEGPQPPVAPLSILMRWRYGFTQEGKRAPFSYQASLGVTRDLARKEIRRVLKEKNRTALAT